MTTIYKTCTVCKKELDVSLFGPRKEGKLKIRSQCKHCEKIYRIKNKEKLAAKYQKNKIEIRKNHKKYYNANKEQRAKVNKKYYLENLIARKEYYKEYYRKNKAKIIAHQTIYQKEYIKAKYKSDPIFKLKHFFRVRVQKYIKRKRWTKKSTLNQYLGCSGLEVKQHIEKQFKPEMTWENHGVHGWHIDHIIPLASATTEDEIYKLCHYTNLQPMWAKDNLSKGSKIEKEEEENKKES